MTPEERAYCDGVRAAAFELMGLFGAIVQKAEDPAAVQRMGRKGSLAALALAQQAGSRITAADVTAEQQEVATGGYDLAALATAPPSTITE